MATLRCTMAGSFFGIVLPKVCYYNPTKVRVIIIRELIAIRNRKQDAFYSFRHSGKVRAVRVTACMQMFLFGLSHRLALQFALL